ncbi:MAG: Gfo/Idh/MocA family protein [Planctomycetota bacterium]
MSKKIARRRFLLGSALAGGAAAVRVARGGEAAERISIGLIGCGDRGTALLREVLALSVQANAAVTALCDVWRVNLERAAALVEKSLGARPRTCARFGDLLTLEDVDAVVIATPDFAHAPILVQALEAGKDAYVEKPMSIEVADANRALDLARSKGRVVQAGTQRRSEGAYRAAARELATGALGRITRVSASVNFHEPRWARAYEDCKAEDVDWDAYLFNRPKRPFDPKLLRRWHLYKDFTNGLSGLWMSHYADSVHFLTGARYPESAVAHGGIYLWKDGREHTDVFHALLSYPEGFLFDWAMSLTNSSGDRFRVHGDLGTLDLATWTISPAGGRRGTPVVERKLAPEADRSHVGNWLACLRSREKPAADIEAGHQHAVATILAARALETGRRQRYDPASREIREG